MKSLAQLLSQPDLDAIFERIHIAVALVNREGNLLGWNAAFAAVKQQYPHAANLADLFHKLEAEHVLIKLREGNKEHWAGEFTLYEMDVPILCDLWLLPASDGNTLFIADPLTHTNENTGAVDKLQRQVKLYQVESEVSKKLARNKQIEMDAVLAQAEEVAHVDALTFLPNRRTILRNLQSEVQRAERYHSTLSISVLDIDHFKEVNDKHGHPNGDEVLRHVALLLRDSIRHPDVVGRYGGEEFIILLPNSDKNAAAEQAARLCQAVHNSVVRLIDRELHVTVSIGVAQFRDEEDSWHSLLKRADNAMFAAKEQGRNRFVVSD